MKKIIFALLLVMLVMGLAGCNNHRFADASERNINIATRAVEIADEFLDANISAATAFERIDSLATVDRDGAVVNLILHTEVGRLRLSLQSAARNDTTENYNAVLERRNTLAVDLGMRRR
ncbi:MAG: hypothetical protein FWD03_03090 [Defluviitaleaceae bacterium]|nr:hypothetical protein [Defluviitaleaceae bacterium]